MLPTDNAKRLLLQQHLLNNRLAQQLSAPATNEMHLQTPPIAVSTVTTSPLSSIHSVSGLGRDNGAGLQTSQESNIFQYLLAADQERRLKRRLSEMQQLRLVDLHQQIQFQRQQQHQSRLFQSHLGRVDRAAVDPEGDVFEAEIKANLVNHEEKVHAPTANPTALPGAAIAPVSRVGEPGQKAGCNQVKETKAAKKGGAQQAAMSSPDKPSASTGGVSRKDARWRQMYEELIEYKNNHNGSCIVPRGFSENPRLASWVAEQRKQYKLMKDGRQSSITPDRVKLLNDVEFAWNAQEAAWVKHMTDLKHFKEQHKHCHVPLNDPTFPKLGLWVKEQRRHYTLMKQGKSSHMTEARCTELDSVGFCWDTHEATWLERLNELRAYKTAQGHCIVPTCYPQNPKLGTWIHHQRRQYKKYKDGKPCHITAERIRALDSLGFVWHPRDRNSCVATTTQDGESKAATDLTNLDLRPRKRQRQT